MRSPLPIDLLDMALRFGGIIDISDGKLSIVTNELPEKLATDIDKALKAFALGQMKHEGGVQ